MKYHWIAFLLILGFTTSAQDYNTKSTTDKNGFTYEYVTNDPFNTRIYTLKNGLTVYLSDYKATPRIQTYIAVRAGSKHDPADHTGLAHYLEHIMFKGTSEIGTLSWKKEKELLDEIETLFELYGETTDSIKRKEIYTKIDAISGQAATYAIANEYDKLVSNIGASGTNAYTSVEQTVYVNNIPQNEIEKWIAIEAERIQEVVPRLFHTELEAVYEEKNRTLDNDRRKAWAALNELMFPNHQYGTQTTIGTIEHLKSPSIKAIKEYFNKYYIPNNVAICLSGDLDYEKTIKLIDQYFGSWKKQPLPPSFTFKKAKPLTAIDTIVYGPDAESVSIGFRFDGSNTKESLLMEYVGMVLSNNQAGLIDINLNQAQKVRGAYAYTYRMKDYSMLILGGQPKEGQSLEEVRELLLEQVTMMREGEFDEWLMKAIINDYKLYQTLQSENNRSRADNFVNAFIHHRSWEDLLNETPTLEKITKEEMVSFVQKHFQNNYVTVFKKTGKDEVAKVEKPQITPVPVNRENHSDFYEEIQEIASDKLKPVFLDYKKDIVQQNLYKNIPILYNQNKENDLFELFYVFDFGENHDQELSLAVSYLNYIGSDKYTPAELKQEFYKLGCSYNVHTSADQLYISITGLNENLEKALVLFEGFMKNPKPDEDAYLNLVGRIIKGRMDAKLSKATILNKGMVSYAKYGKDNPFRNNLSEKELKAIEPKTLTDKLKHLYQYPHRILYYGPDEISKISSKLKKEHKVPSKLKSIPEEKIYEPIKTEKNRVLFVDYDMVQAEIVFLSQSVEFDPELTPQLTLFNEYFGGNMGSIVFQELRESKALAYSVRSYYSEARKLGYPNYVVSYIGTQADKIHEAIEGMQVLLNDLPKSDPTFQNARSSILNSIESARTIKSSILFSYERAKRLGLDYDVNEKKYNFAQKVTFEDIQKFYNEYVKDQSYTMLVIGPKSKIKVEELKKYGEVEELTLEEVFGY